MSIKDAYKGNEEVHDCKPTRVEYPEKRWAKGDGQLNIAKEKFPYRFKNL